MKKTLQHTTRLGKISLRIPLRQNSTSRNPLLQRKDYMNQKQLILSSQPPQVLKDITVLRYSLTPNQEQDLYIEWPQNQMDQIHY